MDSTCKIMVLLHFQTLPVSELVVPRLYEWQAASGTLFSTCGKCRKQARWWESGVKSHYETEHRSPPMSLCSLCIALLGLLCLDFSITVRLWVYLGWDLFWGTVRAGKHLFWAITSFTSCYLSLSAGVLNSTEKFTAFSTSQVDANMC